MTFRSFSATPKLAAKNKRKSAFHRLAFESLEERTVFATGIGVDDGPFFIPHDQLLDTTSNKDISLASNDYANGGLGSNGLNNLHHLSIASLSQAPQHGTVNNIGYWGGFKYQPAAGYVGTDSFTYSYTDKFGHAGSGVVSIEVMNSAPLGLTLSATTIDENKPLGTIIGTLAGIDGDSGETFTYSLVSGAGSDDNGQFQISANRLTAGANFNFEAKNSYNIRVRVTDGAGASYDKPFTITVNDVNEKPTSVSLSNTSVRENQPVGTIVGELSAVDPDVGDSVTYSFVAGAGDMNNSSFQLVGNQLKTAAMFDYETKAVYNIRVAATDAAGLSLQKAFLITIGNDNNPPIIASNGGGSSASIEVPENQTAVTTVTATDADGDVVGCGLKFSISGGADSGKFIIDPDDGKLTFKDPPNFENSTSAGPINVYSVQVKVTDSEGQTDTQLIDVTVTNVNDAPVADVIPPVFHSAIMSDVGTIDLDNFFSDPDDSNEELTFSFTTDGSVSLAVIDIDPTTHLLTINFTSYADIGNVTITGFDHGGNSVSAELTTYNVKLSSPLLERELLPGNWEAVGDGNVVWADDSLRWSVEVIPANVPDVSTIDWTSEHWPTIGLPDPGWASFGTVDVQGKLLSNPGFGYWIVTPRLQLPDSTFVVLQTAKTVPVATYDYVRWEQHDYGDNFPSFSNNKFYAEVAGTEIGAIAHEIVDVEIKLKDWIAAPPGDINARVYLKPFDPDHASSDVELDTNGSSPNDNIAANGAAVTNPNIEAFVDVPNTSSIKRAQLVIPDHQPGNNHIVVASGTEARLNGITFATDGITLLGPDQTPVAANRRTEVLTIWRTLWVEADSMAAPDLQLERFDGAGVGNDDVDPGNIGNVAGTFSFPSLAFLTAELAKANVEVKVVPEPLDDFNDELPFVHNLETVQFAAGNSIRDFSSTDDRWVVQVLAAYEGPLLEDLDPAPNQAEGGLMGAVSTAHDDGSVYIFLETIRDVSASDPNAVSIDRLKQRTVLHEVVHSFGYTLHDFGAMNPATVRTGTDAQNELKGRHLRAIMAYHHPG